MAESEERLKSLLIRMREQSEKAGLKLNIQKPNKIMASSLFMPKEGEKVETVTDFIFLAPKSLWMVTMAMKLKDIFIERKSMTSLDNILKRRHITWPTNIHIVKAMVSPLVMHGCESCTIKKAEH